MQFEFPVLFFFTLCKTALHITIHLQKAIFNNCRSGVCFSFPASAHRDFHDNILFQSSVLCGEMWFNSCPSWTMSLKSKKPFIKAGVEVKGFVCMWMGLCVCIGAVHMNKVFLCFLSWLLISKYHTNLGLWSFFCRTKLWAVRGSNVTCIAGGIERQGVREEWSEACPVLHETGGHFMFPHPSSTSACFKAGV